MSNNPMQRIADLEAQVASLTATNESLVARSNGNGHLNTNKLIEAVGSQIDRSGQILREDFTGKLAALIAPYIDTTLRRCAEVEKQQGELEKKFEQHRKAVGGSAAEMEAAFVKMRKEAAKDWKAQRDLIQSDLDQVDQFIKWFMAELQKSAQRNNGAVASCNLAAERCAELAEKVSAPVEQTVASLREVAAQGKEVLTRAAQRLGKAYNDLREPVLARVMVLLIVTAVIHLGFAGITLWGARKAIDTNWQELTEHSEQQKQEMKDLLNKTLQEVKESQIDREVKVKMWDELMKTVTPQQKQELVTKLREQVRKVGDKRLDDQMSAGQDQMYGKR